jgi:flagellar secretion chaperone FliS
MLDSAVRRYKEVRATTSTPGELLLALYDGLFRFLNGGKVCFGSGQAGRGRELLSKAHAIVSELYIALDHQAAPELCARLSGVYEFCMDRIRQASLRADTRGIDDVIRVLAPLREAWQIAVAEAGRKPLAATG